MLTLEALNARRDLIATSPELAALREHLIERAQPVLARMPPIPAVKALLSRDGGVCPDDGTSLAFDPWSPDAHRCPRCGKSFSAPRHHAHWARAQHLWVAERAAHLATLHATANVEGAAARARELLAAYYDLYFKLPNRDNVLGPSHLFFSTYLESIWILDYLTAAFILRECDALTPDDVSRIDAIADEAANLIAEFNEGMSNRQTWNSAALTAIAAWFGDDELAETAIQGRTGLLGHLADGFGADGMWHEGDNYHLFALRGLLIGLHWAETIGARLLDDAGIAAHLGQALLAPTATSLPDFTFPARKDSRYGVSLAHPAYLECWEYGGAALGNLSPPPVFAWLHALYRVPPQPEQTYDAYLHDAGYPLPSERSRTMLSWWSLLSMLPTLPPSVPWEPTSVLLEQQGLAVLRSADTYVSLECGGGGAGHAHPDRLNLTLCARGMHWLPDPGTGSYVTRDLAWYRSTLAHNAPMPGGRDQSSGDGARCTAWHLTDKWSWCAGTWGDIRRSVIVGSRWVVDIVDRDSAEGSTLLVPWHLMGELFVADEGAWENDALDSEFVGSVERLAAAGTLPRVDALNGDHALAVWFRGDGELLRATGPGLPGSNEARRFLVRRFTANKGSMVSVIDFSGEITGVNCDSGGIHIRDGDTVTTVSPGATDVTIVSGAERIQLGGARAAPLRIGSFLGERPPPTVGQATWIEQPPALDGSLSGFATKRPLHLDEEYQYFRSEDAYAGPEAFSAIAHVNWSRDDLYLAVDVTTDDVIVRGDDAMPLRLDNEADDVNADGIQVYYRSADDESFGWLIRPGPGSALRARAIAHSPGTRTPEGAWQRTPTGYRITVSLPCPHLDNLRRADRIEFDLIVNEMRGDRMRRAGQLIWSGGPGWVYLRGDRHDPEQFGELELTR